MGNMKFRGLSTKDLDLIIQFKPDYPFPAKDITVEHIPGRNGDLYIDNKSWQNTQRTYSIVSVFRPGTDFVSNSEKLIKWLTQESGYFRLEDDYDPHVYRMAAYKGSGSLPNLYDQATVLAVTFDCKPQRYLKSGEKEITFEDVSKAILLNPTGFDALPDIRISNISNPAQDDVLLLTVGKTSDEENFDEVTSVITLSEIPNDVTSITLISEDQTCYSNQNGNINGSINLNDTQFPVLGKDISMVTVKKHVKEETAIEAYNKKIEASQLMCQCKYLPYDAQVKAKEKITVVESWNLLKQRLEEVYDAKSYATYCMEKADTYTFESYNNLLMSKGVRYTVRPASDEVDDQGRIKEAPWLKLSNNGNGTYTVSVGDISDLIDPSDTELSHTSGYFYMNKGSIEFKLNDEVLTDSLKDSGSLQVDFYPATFNGGIAVQYESPDWCEMQVEYNFNGTRIVSINSISYVAKKTGYYYLPKTFLKKASWSKVTPNTVLTTLKWNPLSKAFMPSGISVSKAATFTYYFLPYPYKTPEDPNNPTPEEKWLQYEPVMEYKLDKDGNPELDGDGNKIPVVANDVNFYVDNVSDDLTTLKLKAKVSAWFRNDQLKLNQFQTKLDGYSTIDVDSEISMPADFKATSHFIIYTIRSTKFPTYEDQKEWPKDYIDGIPKNIDGSANIYINPSDGQIDFKIKKRAWYRVKYQVTSGETTNDRYSSWVLINQNGLLFLSLGLQDFTMAANQNISIERLEALEDSDDFPIGQYTYHGKDANNNDVDVPDIAFFDKDGTLYTNNQAPSWVKVIVVKGDKDDYTDCTLQFNVGDSAVDSSLFKWDTRSIWMSKNKVENGHMTDSARKDDTTIYYLNKLPTCLTNQDVDHPEISTSDKFKAIVLQNSATGDPESISFYPLTNGYYKPKNSSNWKWFTTANEICLSKNSETTIIQNLTESQQQDNYNITIIPRWWSL